MSKTFKGRAVVPGNIKGLSVVTKNGFNILASMQRDLMAKKEQCVCSDQNNPDLFGKVLTGKVLCLPRTIGSTTGGMVLQTAASLEKAPCALLFSEAIDSLAAGGVICAKVWNDRDIITVDSLGDEFLNTIKNDSEVTISEDGTVTIM